MQLVKPPLSFLYFFEPQYVGTTFRIQELDQPGEGSRFAGYGHD